LRRRSAFVALFAFVLVLSAPRAAFAASPSTTASVPSASTLTLGGSVTDTATVTGDPIVGSPSGTVSFFVCGPSGSAAECAIGGTAVGTPVTLPDSPAAAPTATSPSFTPTSPGTWCFRADYSGDTNYSGSGDGSSGECFTVGQASSTTASTPQQASTTLGAQNADAATVTGNTGSGAPSGKVGFYVCGPLGSAAGCATGGTAVGSADLSSAGADKATATSPPFTAASPGTWCFRADYSGDANHSGSSDSSSAECFTVGQAASTTASTPQQGSVTLGAQNADAATVTGDTSSGSPSGAVNFFVCGPLGSAAGCATGGTPVGSAPLSPGSGNTATATSPSFIPTSPGTWCFRAEYSGDTNYSGSSDSSSGECFTVGQASSTTASGPQHGSITLGGQNADAATVTGAANARPPSGTVSFYVCGPLSSRSGCPSGVGTPVGTASLSPGGGNTATATSPPFTPTSTGTWCFRADYAGDPNYTSSGDGSSTECFSVSQSSSTTASKPDQSPITLGAHNTDTANVTGNAAGGAPQGTVSFHICGPLSTPSGCTSGGTAVGTANLPASPSGNTASATSPTFTPTSTGIWCFRADYAGDGSQYNPSTDGSPGECFTVTQAPSITASTPQQGAVRVRTPNADSVTVTGAANAKPPTGTVSFRVCGPLSSRSGCASGGTAVGTASLSPGSDNTATAGSPSFTPTSPGTWCFRADYSGDGNYHPSADDSSGECFTVAMSDAPLATIASPRANATYRLGQIVAASYRCDEAAGGPGVASCAGTVANGSPIDTSTLGAHTFSVTARSYDGLSTTVVAGYKVAAPPSVAISSPAPGATYTRGQSIGVSFSCAEGSFGPGLAMCSGPTAFSTSRTGTYAFTVTANSTDGQRSTRTVYFHIVLPSNRFKVSHLRRRRDGRITFQLTVPGAGTVNVLETAPARALPRSRAGRLVIARLHLTPRKARTIQVVVRPDARGRSIVRQRRFAALLRLAVMYTPTNGTLRSATFSGSQIRP
jgi:hypothetical protein